MRNISLSNNTIQRRISDMSMDVKEQILSEIKASPFFPCKLVSPPIELKTTTKGKYVMEMISSFFESNGLQWKNLCGVCTDGAPAILRSRSGFQTKVKELPPQAKGTHCIIHRFALATKTLPKPLQEVLDSLVTIVNDIKSSALNTRSDDERDKLELEPAMNMLRSLILEGYDHILDAHTSNSSRDNQGSFRSRKTNILEVATESTYLPIISLLRSVPIFEERREWLHSAIRAGSLEHTQEILLATSDSFDDTLRDSSPPSLPTSPSLSNSPEDVKIDLHHQDWIPMELNSSEKFSSFLGPPALAVAKNRRSRCSMHIAVLCQQLEIARFIAHHFPQTLHVGDNLERTPLHYAMGIPSVDTFSQILIQAGAKRIVKDLTCVSQLSFTEREATELLLHQQVRDTKARR
ncbi:hypothetical protein J437_LFUL015528 [Ladona fulva]|uniref:Uncharacterized protein n=1 Tax=Ladona fulva TaxID=123851 RepID=A0A8K0P604_LADFU|nr:hypothetical protein J437_LFUL015528 [Ladona fulva]